MFDIHIMDWAKKRPKKHYNNIHGLRVFELIFCRELEDLGLQLDELNSITLYCLADPNKDISYSEMKAFQEVEILLPDDYMLFIELESVEEKYQAFCNIVRSYVVPVLEKYSSFSLVTTQNYVEEALEEIVSQGYEASFLVAKTPKKSPNRKLLAMLRGVHRYSGFQLWCEVYNERGLRIINELLVEEVGNEVVYARFLGQLKWESNQLITIKSKTSSWMKEVHIPL
ncbi:MULTISPECIES: hypothetical protein [Bacillaceae]|uniref:hypothetical protein n=2 Tax=Bacillales TaxID=1385 RepID=UPI00064F24EC|nr:MULTISPECIES: hypothetical protein [Bacillaceae]NLR43600.1 hypothetical protein [Priestia megaterium]KML26976.1 hypothetical protein VL11_18530 [Priestia aryabhattai]KMN98977.1 hypothetical protein ABV89_13720 [Priestia aryabhattai]KZE12865.1 hypothetical protein AVW12_04545 [Priestia aryabhattai]MED4393206.1 hypothetical protein [Priestia aryabhattai]